MRVEIKQAGYVYIYFSNENETPIDVYFDDFRVTHTHSPVVQRDDYYPFGLTFNSQTREDATAQRWKFQGQEHVDDPLIEAAFDWTPYRYAFCNPISFIDPDGQYELPAAQAKKYQRLNNYLQKGIQDIVNNKTVMNALLKHGEFTEEQIKTVLEYGKDPKINVTDLDNAYGEFTPGEGSDELRLDVDLVESLESAEGDDRDALLFLTAVTILHETTHYGDDQDGVQQVDGDGKRIEEGLEFEKEAYGKIITGGNANETIETWKEKQPEGDE